jgi:hypothetical protein
MPSDVPGPREIREAIGTLRVYLQPAADKHISDCLARMALVMRARDGSAAEWKARAGEYMRILSGYPTDIWNEVCDALIGETPFFPTPADLKIRLDAGLSLRQRRIKRLEAMLTRPANDRNEPKEPRAKRLRAVVNAWKELPENSMAKSVLGASARNSEIELAEIENRKPEAWAMEVV